MRSFLLIIFTLTCFAIPSVAQESKDGLEEAYLGRFNYSANRLIRLAEALPEDVYSWKPNEDGMSIELVFMHISRYNYLYPEQSFGMPAPEGIDLDAMESLTGKENVLKHLKPSLDYARSTLVNMSVEERTQLVELYGSQTQAWNVFLQLQMHMAEHLGQLLAYSRANDIVPPWSQ